MINRALLHLGFYLEAMGWIMLMMASKVFHTADHHMHCSRIANLADAADSIDRMHMRLQQEHIRAKSARQN